MKKGCSTLALLAGLACLSGLAAWLYRAQHPAQTIAESARIAPRPRQAARQDEDTEDASNARDAGDRQAILKDWQDLSAWLHGVPPPDAEQVRERLKTLRVRWAALDPQVLAETLGGLLETGDDLTTGLAFKVGAHGFLDGWPTLRVFLLDVLAASDPEAAAVIARKTLDATPSADEYAVAMRSLTHPGPGRADDGELLTRFGTLLGHAGWESQPGFAEAFDLPRLVGSPEAGRELAAWTGNPALRSMALEEFAADHPASIVATMTSDEAAGLDAATRSNLMARLDPADGGQLAAADAYLRNPGLSPDEAANFLKIFPLRSATTGERLYGDAPAPYDREGIAAGDRAALEQVNLWLADPALANYRSQLEPLQQRLADWVKQAAAR